VAIEAAGGFFSLIFDTKMSIEYNKTVNNINFMQEKKSEYTDRIKKLDMLKQAGVNPYPARAERDCSISEVLRDFKKLTQAKKTFHVAGRLRSVRLHGNLAFGDLEDETGRIQIVFNKKDMDTEDFKLFTRTVDASDFIGIEGTTLVTKTGQNSIAVAKWTMLAKALRQIPDEHFGFKDEEERLRKRYLDILLNKDLRETIVRKGKFWQAVRNFLLAKGFAEVETPVLETTTGGADARPFITHHNALDVDVYLRISCGELWQKRLMVAGFEKTFEIGRIFRNEGISAEHAQDYTQMEFYWAYADYEKGMALVEEMFKHVAKEVFGTLKFSIKNFAIDLGNKWERYDYTEIIKKRTGVDIAKASVKDIEKKLKELDIAYDNKGFNITRGIDNLWKYCRKDIAGPGFLVNVPIVVSPLAKQNEARPQTVQRFQPIIAGSELGNGYSELNDPIDQRERFAGQQKLRDAGDDEAQMADYEFVEALEYGMPPTCGFGMSERVFNFLSDKTLRDCQTFPLVRPKIANSEQEIKNK